MKPIFRRLAIVGALCVMLVCILVLTALPWAARAETKPAKADASTCYTIADADQRAYCRAKAHRNASLCYAVQRADLRAQCLAEVRR